MNAAARDRFELETIAAVVAIVDAGRTTENEEQLETLKVRALALLDAWAHERARQLVCDHVLTPALLRMRAFGDVADILLSGEGAGWKPVDLPFDDEPDPSRARWRWKCEECADEIVLDFRSRLPPGPSMISALDALVSIHGWRVMRPTPGGPAFARCERCTMVPAKTSPLRSVKDPSQ